MEAVIKLNRSRGAKKNEATVLVVDADTNQLESICRGVFLQGHRCLTLKTVSEAIDFLNCPAGVRVDILITDLTNHGSDGLALIRHVRDLHPALPVIAICGLMPSDDIEAAREAGVLILRRPFHPDGLNTVIRDSVA